MTKHNRLFTIAVSALLLITHAQAQTDSNRIRESISVYADVLRTLDTWYVDTLNYEMLTETAIGSMLKKVDPYTEYYPKRRDDEIKQLTTGVYGGVGSVIMQRDGWVYISEPYENLPAQRAGLRAGDKILTVDGNDCKGKTTSQVSQMLRGKQGSTVKVTIEREGNSKPISIDIVRERIHTPTVDYAGKVTDRTGYIMFSEFTEGSARDFKKALDELSDKGITNLIIDLRGNGGGLMNEAVEIVSNFVDSKTEVVRTRSRDGKNDYVYRTHRKPQYPTMPIVILVDNNTASAAEIVAGSMQDLDRATIIGERTYGKGLVQNIRQIEYDGHLKLTTARYYIPSGRCIQAIDYSHRLSDGSVEHIPDSLTHEFRTAGGRIVRDGGGISPDIERNDTSSKLDISYTLYANNMYFDYATRYRQQHESIAPASTFIVTDSLLTDFEAFLEEKKFVYETETSKYYARLIDMAKHEDIDQQTIEALEAIKPQLCPSFHDAISRQKDNVAEQLGAEIISRYYYERGRICYMLRWDKQVTQAIDALKE